MDGSSLSHHLSREVVWLAAQMPFAQVSAALERLSQLSVPATTVWRQVEQHGEHMQQQVEQERERVSVERTYWQHQKYAPQARLALAFDGGMVYIRGEGWKELKVGTVGHIQRQWTASQQVIRLSQLHYVGVVGDVKAFKPALWELAVHHDVPYAGHTVITADGAVWIWRLAADLFPCSVQIVDWYHATQHLAQAVQARYRHDPTIAHHWLHQLKTYLYRGQIDQLVAELVAANLTDHTAYFRQHKRRMQYQAFWNAGYPIGSGAVESGVKQYKQRLAGPGMRWSRSGATRMVTLRSAVLSNTFDRLWRVA